SSLDIELQDLEGRPASENLLPVRRVGSGADQLPGPLRWGAFEAADRSLCHAGRELFRPKLHGLSWCRKRPIGSRSDRTGEHGTGRETPGFRFHEKRRSFVSPRSGGASAVQQKELARLFQLSRSL